MTLEKLFTQFVEFGKKTFIGANAMTSLEKLKDEAEELQHELLHGHEDLLEEYIDCMMCLLDSANRAGFSIEEIKIAFALKLSKNMNRTWKRNENGTYSHVQ